MDVRGRPDRSGVLSRPDRSGVRSLKLGSRTTDLIEDIHRQHRRRILKRAAQFTALVLALLFVGVAFKVVADRRARSQALDKAHQHYVGGTVADLEEAVEVLAHSLEVAPEHEATRSVHALMLAHLWTEFGSGGDEARRTLDALSLDTPTGSLASAFMAFAEGDLETARARLDAAGEVPDDVFFEGERLWLTGMLTVATRADDEPALRDAIASIEAYLAHTRSVAHQRVHALLLLLAGDHDEALRELEQARKTSRRHMGLAADEAYYNAYLHQELAGVASVADQLLATPAAELSPRDRAHVLLARAVVHMRSGETPDGLSLLDEAWGGLAEWNVMARELALQTALEGADDTRVEAWIEQTTLPKERADAYRAWARLVRGDVMTALEELARLPQDDPWVGYLQALALVEQLRFQEAQAWVQRAQRIMPGRNELDVAQARVELRVGDETLGLGKLAALAEEEPYAPRAWTGLGEAHLLQKGEVDERKAKKAFEKAVQREPAPAEALLQLARLSDARRKVDPEAERQALELMEQAAKANPYLPRYREALAVYAMELGYDARARELMRALTDVPGVTAATVLALAELEIESRAEEAVIEGLFERAAALGGDGARLERLRAKLLLTKGTREDAAAAAEKLEALLDADPADVETRVLHARALLQAFDRKGAESVVRKGFSTIPENRHGRLHLAWAEIENRTGKRKAAAPRARSAWLRMLEEDRPARELLSAADLATRLWVRQQQNRVALTIAKQLTSRLAFHGDAWTIRAQTELSIGEAGSARESAERAIDLDKDNPRAHAILGHALLRFGHKDRARESYERAIELAVGTSEEKDYRDNLRRL